MAWITSSFRNGYRGQTTSARRSGSKPKPCAWGTRRRQHRWLPLKRPWVKIASARIVARQVPYRVARQGVLRRYQCKGCRKTFNAATGTPLSGLHRKDKWLAFGTCLADGLTVRASAERCGLAVNTALRWRHRFPAAKDLKARKLTGIVEADETCVLESRKGARNLERKARRRGGKASRQGLSDEQVPVLVVADRSGATVSAVLPAVNADTLRAVIEPIVDEGIVLVTDGHRACPRCAAAIGAHHEALNLSRSERMRGAFHIQIAADPAVNNRHSRLKDFLRRYRGVATRYLDNDLRWFQRLELENASPRACLATAIARLCIQFETEPSGLICSPVPFPSTLTRLPQLSSRPKGAKLQADGGTFECRLTLKRISNSPTRAIETFQTSRTTAIRFLGPVDIRVSDLA